MPSIRVWKYVITMSDSSSARHTQFAMKYKHEAKPIILEFIAPSAEEAEQWVHFIVCLTAGCTTHLKKQTKRNIQQHEKEESTSPVPVGGMEVSEGGTITNSKFKLMMDPSTNSVVLMPN